MDPDDGAALPHGPLLPPELLERVGQFVESHDAALARARSSKSVLRIGEAGPAMLGQF